MELLGTLLLTLWCVMLFDAVHHLPATEEVLCDLGRQFTRDNDKLVVNNFAPYNLPASGNQAGTPLKYQAEIPNDETCEHARNCCHSGRATAEVPGDPLQENGKAEDKKNGEGDKEAISEGRNAVPVRIGCNDVVESENGEEDRTSYRRITPREKEQPNE